MTNRDPADRTSPSPSDDVDPTGVRAILAALPDPGPMPADLVARINTSLEAERLQWSPDGWAPGGSTGTRSTDESSTNDHSTNDSHTDGHAAASGTVRSLAEARERRSGIGQYLPSIAMAASVVVLAGAVILGVVALTGGGISFSDTSATVAGTSIRPSGSDAGNDSADDSAGLADTQAAPEAATEAGDAGAVAELTPESTAPMAVAAAPVFATGAQLTTAMIAGHAAELRARTIDPQAHQLEGVPSDSPVSSPAGAADCLSLILDDDAAELVQRLAAIDFVDYDEEPAAMILLRDAQPTPDPGAVGSEPMTAYLVPDDCGLSEPRMLTEPVRLDS